MSSFLVFFVCTYVRFQKQNRKEKEEEKETENRPMNLLQNYNKTLGRALNPRTNGAWLSQLTE